MQANEKMTALLDAAQTIATQSTDVILAHFRSGVEVHNKADASPVTVADRAAESAIRQAISDRFPGHGIMGEEHGAANLDREYVWVVDPIDGTKSFISGVPLFGTLVGVLRHGRPVAGVIHMPGLREIFAGAPGLGSWFNGAPIHWLTGPFRRSHGTTPPMYPSILNRRHGFA